MFCLDVPAERLPQFVGEMEELIAADLTHPGIAAPLGTGIAGSSAYLAQDFVAADPLDVAWRGGHQGDSGEVVRVAVQIAGALDSAAEAGIVHGALHPADVLVTPDDARLTGLGIARALETIGVPSLIRLPYAAPERAAGDEWDRRADVFSLAAVMFERLWGRRVMGVGDRAVEAITPVGDADLEQLRSVFARGLAEDPEDRFETALAFADALKGCLSVAAGRSVIDRGGALVHSAAPIDADFRGVDHDERLESGGLWLFLDEPDPHLGKHTPGDDVSKELDLFAGERSRDEAVAPASTLPSQAAVSGREAEARKAPLAPSSAARFSDYAAERSRSAVWPLVLALLVGLAVGGAATFLLLNRDRPAPVAADVQTDAGAVGEPSAPPSSPPAGPASDSAVPPMSAATPAPPPAPAPPSRAERGRLTVRSTPAGARVFVDGRDVGVTPMTVGDLDPGTVTVRLVREGYLTAERQVSMRAAGPAQSVSVALSRARPARTSAPDRPASATTGRNGGTLFVRSRPAGANVYVDGKLVGTTPMQLEEVGTGSHVVGLELEGYNRWSSTVRIPAGERVTVSASLER
jgi:hypothetical protein